MGGNDHCDGDAEDSVAGFIGSDGLDDDDVVGFGVRDDPPGSLDQVRVLVEVVEVLPFRLSMGVMPADDCVVGVSYDSHTMNSAVV